MYESYFILPQVFMVGSLTTLRKSRPNRVGQDCIQCLDRNGDSVTSLIFCSINKMPNYSDDL
jgi:hypothetical protein